MHTVVDCHGCHLICNMLLLQLIGLLSCYCLNFVKSVCIVLVTNVLCQKNLKVAKREGDKLHQLHLEALLNKAILDNKQKRTKALTYLIRAKRNCMCYARFRQHTKPKASGGLVYITVPDENGEPQPLLDQQDLESTLLDHSRKHFAQVEGSPFTVDPINRLLQYDGLTLYGDRITKGHLPDLHVFDEQMCAILQHLKRKVPAETSTVPTLDYDILLKGIQKWTTTSPLG